MRLSYADCSGRYGHILTQLLNQVVEPIGVYAVAEGMSNEPGGTVVKHL
jgi:hypothetical protein